MFEGVYKREKAGDQIVQRRLTVKELQYLADNDLVSDLNLIYRSNTKTAFAAFRLCSWDSRDPMKPGRVTKFLVEIGTYDSSRPKGQRQKDYIQIFLDDHDFAYFCGLMKDGRIFDVMDRCERQGEKVPYKKNNGKGDAKRLRIYRGQKQPLILEAAQGPGKDGGNGQTLPDDWSGKNKQKVRKTMIALSEEEVCKIGAAGERALSMLDMWRAFGRDEEMLTLINVRKSSSTGAAAQPERRQSERSYGNGASYRSDPDAGRSGSNRSSGRYGGYSDRGQDYGYSNGYGYAARA